MQDIFQDQIYEIDLLHRISKTQGRCSSIRCLQSQAHKPSEDPTAKWHKLNHTIR
jgi:hypothetical protein